MAEPARTAFDAAIGMVKALGQKADWLTKGHFIVGGVYAKEVHIPAGHMLVGHVHAYDHLSILASGEVLLSEGDGALPKSFKAPAAIEIKAGVEHAVYAHLDSVWYCLHRVPDDLLTEEDARKLDAAVIVV